ncbi:hypothetical protein IFM58399_00772 [Aspergillus lentulus]|uniref:uncharacterized protein n=1 Tax=Aspergillus lentulus TaxID=293939 RepID=UPI0013959E73|nr:uncharacterized protein IFM58399_00772 [Aspergillus lentulus]GFF24764.1 hypothetical protein IFM58399_00772 [Aspergillus lentulus]
MLRHPPPLLRSGEGAESVETSTPGNAGQFAMLAGVAILATAPRPGPLQASQGTAPPAPPDPAPAPPAPAASAVQVNVYGGVLYFYPPPSTSSGAAPPPASRRRRGRGKKPNKGEAKE